MTEIYLGVLSSTFGWIYVFAWSFSFWPQIIMNCRHQSVRGLSFDLWWYNCTAYVSYFLYRFITYVQDQDHKIVQRVTFSDLAFTSLCVFATIIILLQITWYGSEGQRISDFATTIILTVWGICLYNILISCLGYLPWWNNSEYSTVAYLGYVKDLLTFVKYVPQCWINFRDKTTKGWSIGYVIFDLIGWTFSLAKQCVDSVNLNDWSIMFGNIPKLVLALESMLFDFLFLVQHYVLYGSVRERSILVENSRREGSSINSHPTFRKTFY